MTDYPALNEFLDEHQYMCAATVGGKCDCRRNDAVKELAALIADRDALRARLDKLLAQIEKKAENHG